MSDYIPERLTSKNIDLYGHRTSIVKALREALPRLSGRLLDVGCGNQPYRELLTAGGRVTEYVGIDMPGARYISPDLLWDGVGIPGGECEFDCAILTEVLEHCPAPESLLREVRRVLRAGGVLFLTVPFIWPLHEIPHDEYRYTPFALRRLLAAGGFEEDRITALGGWDASLAQLLGLWARRRPMPRWKRNVVSFLLVPLIRRLLSRDIVATEFYDDSMMYTGFAATAVRRH